MLSEQDFHHLQAAEGWLELGNLAEAAEELEKISRDNHGDPDVLELSSRLFQAGGKWEWSLSILEPLSKQFPTRLNLWLLQGKALHAIGKTHLAYGLLVDVVELFPENQTIRFDIACYAAERGLKEESLEWLKIVFKLDGDNFYRRRALEEPMLQKLAEEIRSL